MCIDTNLYQQALRVVGYNSQRQYRIEIGFLKNEPQTMMTFVSRVHHKALHDQFKVGIYPEVRKILSTETDQVQRRGRLPQA